MMEALQTNALPYSILPSTYEANGLLPSPLVSEGLDRSALLARMARKSLLVEASLMECLGETSKPNLPFEAFRGRRYLPYALEGEDVMLPDHSGNIIPEHRHSKHVRRIGHHGGVSPNLEFVLLLAEAGMGEVFSAIERKHIVVMTDFFSMELPLANVIGFREVDSGVWQMHLHRSDHPDRSWDDKPEDLLFVFMSFIDP